MVVKDKNAPSELRSEEYVFFDYVSLARHSNVLHKYENKIIEIRIVSNAIFRFELNFSFDQTHRKYDGITSLCIPTDYFNRKTTVFVMSGY